MARAANTPAKRAPRRGPQVYLLRVELEDITPLNWRRLWIGGGATLLELHHVL